MTNYLINLAPDTARLAFQRDQFAKFGLSFERVEACRDDPAERDRFRWWCAVLRPAVPGEIGCALSHRKAYRELVRSGAACAAVFEDDVGFSPVLLQALALAERQCREDPLSVVLLGDHRKTKGGEPLADEGTVPSLVGTDWDFCSEAYVIGCAAAATLLRKRRRISTPADAWGYFRGKGFIHLYRVTPPVCRQRLDRFGTTIGERYVVDARPPAERIWWKLRRAVGVLVDGILDGGHFGW